MKRELVHPVGGGSDVVSVRHDLRRSLAFPAQAEVPAVKVQCHFTAGCSIIVASRSGCVGTSVGNRTGARGLHGHTAPASANSVAGLRRSTILVYVDVEVHACLTRFGPSTLHRNDKLSLLVTIQQNSPKRNRLNLSDSS